MATRRRNLLIQKKTGKNVRRKRRKRRKRRVEGMKMANGVERTRRIRNDGEVRIESRGGSVTQKWLRLGEMVLTIQVSNTLMWIIKELASLCSPWQLQPVLTCLTGNYLTWYGMVYMVYIRWYTCS